MPDNTEPVVKTRAWKQWGQRLNFRKYFNSGSKPPPDGPHIPKKSSSGFSVKRIFGRIFKYSFVTVCVAVIITIVSYNIFRLIYDDNDIKALVESTVQTQTGGKLVIGDFRFRILRGIRLSQIEFYSEAQPAADVIPLAKIDKMELAYSIPKIFTGRFHIAALKLTRPSIYLTQEGESFNFSKILEHRKKNFPQTEPPPPPEAEKPTDAASDSPLPFNMALLYMPIEIMVRDIGIQNLDLTFIKSDNNRVIEKVQLKGATIDLGAFWHLAKSNFWVSVSSTFENPLHLTVDGQETPAGPQPKDKTMDMSKGPPALKRLIEVKSAQVIHFSLEDFESLNLDIASRFPTVKVDNISQDNASIYMKSRIRAVDNYKRIAIDTIEAQVLDVVTYMIKGELSVPYPKMEKISLNINQSASFDLKKAAELISPFVKGIGAQGKVRIENLIVNGDLDLLKLNDPTKAEGLPALSGVVWLDQVKASLENSGLNMDPLSGRISLLSTPKATQNGIQADLSVDLNIPKVSVEKIQDKIGKIEAGVKNLSIKLLSRLVWPDAVLPIVKLDLEAQHVTASGAKIAPVDVPLFLNINAEGDKNLSQLAMVQNFQLGNLAEISAMFDCQQSCSRFRANLMARLESFTRLYAIVAPTKGTIIPENFAPKDIEGNLDFQFNAKGQIPNPLKSPLATILKEGDVRFSLQSRISKLSTVLPFMNLAVKSFDNRILASGDLKEQQLEISQKFDKLKLNLPPPEGKTQTPPVPSSVEAERYSFDLAVKNSFSSTIDLQKPLANMTTKVETWLYAGRIDFPAVLPKQLSELSFDTVISQSKLKSIDLESISLKIPDYGTSLKLSAHAEVAEDFIPTQFSTTVTSQINHNGNENLPGGIKTVGRLDSKISLSSPNMKLLAIDGSIGFDKFSFGLFDKKNPDIKVVSIDDISGEMPLKQTIKIPYIRDILNKQKESPKKAETLEKSEVVVNDDKAVKNIASNDNIGGSTSESLTDSMDLYIDKTKDKLSENTNTVSLVDYSSIRPFFPKKKPISIRRVEVANLELSNLEFDIEVKQNWFALNQYIISFLGGKIQGAFLLAFDANFPNLETIAADLKKVPKSFRTSVQLTRLDTRKLIDRFPNLKGKGDSFISVFSNPYLDGTVQLSYDMLTNEMGGGIEITSIGKEQLKMILYYVDPFEQNPTISDIRSALNLGEVRQVSIPIKNGEIGMSVDVRVLGAPLPTPKLTRFPLSQMIKNFIDQGSSQDKKPEESTVAPKSAAVYRKKEEPVLWSKN